MQSKCLWAFAMFGIFKTTQETSKRKKDSTFVEILQATNLVSQGSPLKTNLSL